MKNDCIQRVEKFSRFVQMQKNRCSVRGAALLGSALGTLARKYHKIWLLRESTDPKIVRYGDLLNDRMTWFGQLSANQEVQIVETSNLEIEIELGFESFFLYSAMLCDDIAHLYLYLFGPARGVKLSGHRELAKNLGPYTAALKLCLDAELDLLAKQLEFEVCEYRDKQIVHDFHARKLDTLSFNPDLRDVVLTYAILYPKHTDKHVSSKTWGQLIEMLDRYVWLSLSFVEQNLESWKYKDKDTRE